ncbi:MAG: hypothetical protein ACRDGV_10445 [Candidatus Limnocylindria bacterium]
MSERHEDSQDDPGPPADRPIRGPWPAGMPYTIYLLDRSGSVSAAFDLEHPAPLPRSGEEVEHFDAEGRCTRWMVEKVVHTLQPSAASRPAVREGRSTPNAMLGGGQMLEPHPQAGLRAGLPKVFLRPLDD